MAKQIDNFSDWLILKTALKEKGYSLFQFQYRWSDENGFHAWFMNSNGKQVEVITFKQEIQRDIIDNE